MTTYLLLNHCFEDFEGLRRIQDVNLKLSTITPPKNAPAHKLSVSTAPQAPTITLHQLTDARNLINACLDVIDISKWTGDPQDADFISGQLRLLSDNVSEARQALKGGAANQRPWWEAPIDDEVGIAKLIKPILRRSCGSIRTLKC